MDLMERTSMNGDQEARDTIFVLGGAALMLLGAGLILSTPTVRRYLGAANLGSLMSSSLPDLERYMRMRSI